MEPRGTATCTAETLATDTRAVVAAPGFVLSSRDGWTFTAPDAAGEPSSSGRKTVLHGGRFRGPGRDVAAVAVAFDARHGFEFGIECAALARFGQIGAGPELLAMARVAGPSGDDALYLVEEDVGVSLEAALFEGAAVPGDAPLPLAPLGTAERRAQNQKIAFDVLCQLKALHENGLYHRDLRPANVCVRRIGPAPADIRATLVDLEGVASTYDAMPRAIYHPYYDLLFCCGSPVGENPAAPTCGPFPPTPLDIDMGYLALLLYELDGGWVEGSPGLERSEVLGLVPGFLPPGFPPTPLDIDMGYLALLLYELDGGWVEGSPGLERSEVLGLVPGFLPPGSGEFLTVGAHGVFSPRRIDAARDLDPLACALGLTPLGDVLPASPGARGLAAARIKHGGYLDRADLERIENDPECLLEQGVEELARLNYASPGARGLAAARIKHGGYLDRADLERIENDPECLLEQGVEELARLNYRIYAAGMRRRGAPVCGRFEDQPAELQESGRLSARHTLAVLEQLGYELVRLGHEGERGAVSALTPWEVERFAMIEHERWVSERLAAGWRWGAVKDAAQKTNPCLVSYGELPESEKDKNRAKAAAAPGHLRQIGLALVRVERGASLGSGVPDEEQLVVMARASFESYKAHRRRDGLPVEYERYEDQPETLRRSGIAQARGLWDKAALLGCAVVPAGEAAGEQRVERLSDGEVELLARVEHDRWVAERLADGWVPGPVRDPKAKTTPYLVDYDELTEEIKEYDRQPMRELVDRLAAAGFALVRRG